MLVVIRVGVALGVRVGVFVGVLVGVDAVSYTHLTLPTSDLV